MSSRARGIAARIDAATPADRDRYVDLLRAFAIVVVVLGHWTVTAVFVRDGELTGVSVLNVAAWTHWVTWAFQVMPVFFLVGGYANATSWRRHAAEGGSWQAWVHRRSVRLLGPTAVFVSVATAAAVVVAQLADVDRALMEQAGWVAGIALWFLAAYTVVAGLTPVTHRLHDRFGSRAALALAAAVAAGDLARLATGDVRWSAANFVLGWVLIHQVGYWWRDSAVPSSAGRSLLLALGGAVTLVALVAGPWPVSMIDVAGATIQNSSPPSLALLSLATVQIGVILAVAAPARRWLRRPLPWAAVATVNRVVLTVFLWHMAALVTGAAALYGTRVLPDPAPLSAAWFAWRPVWLAALAIILTGLVIAFAPVERRAGQAVTATTDAPRVAAALAGVGLPLACLGLVLLTLGGLVGDGPLGIPVPGIAMFASGTAMTFVAGRVAPQPRRASPERTGQRPIHATGQTH